MRRIAFVLFVSLVLLPAAAIAGDEVAPAGRVEMSGSKANVPLLINYQGTLTDPAGAALDTTVMLMFNIYIDSTGMLPVWTEHHPAVTVDNGVFNVLLGQFNPLIYLFTEPDRWLGVQVDFEPEMRPLQRMAAVPYAIRAAEADTADYARGAPSAADGDWTIAGSDMYSAVSGHVGIGKTGPAAKLDVAGTVSTDSSYQIGGETVLSVEGFKNVFVGENTGKNNYGFHNTFVGDEAGKNNDVGAGNSFVGARAGSTNTDGSENSFFGTGSGRDNTTGSVNTFLGYWAGRSNTEGSHNAFLGKNTGFHNTTGNRNTFLGLEAGYRNTTGEYNVFVGQSAGSYNTEGDNNTYVGSGAGGINSIGSRNVFLGSGAGTSETGSDKLYIANGGGASEALIYGEFDNGKVGLGTLAPEAHLHVQSSHQHAGLFESDSSSSSTHVVHAEYTGSSTDAKAVYGKAAPADYYGFGGYFVGGFVGLYATVLPTGSQIYTGVYGEVSGGSGMNYGVYGSASGSSGTNYAGYFNGLLHATTATASVKAFKIDHPLDPENRYLYHSSVESPDMKNVYDGVVMLDSYGQAWINLPDYFEALNQDFRYQLTCIGGFAPVYVAEEISGNRFQIAGGDPGMKISWQVTGIRHDPVAETGRIEAEKMKPARERGKYLNPEAYGQPERMGVGYVDREKMRSVER